MPPFAPLPTEKMLQFLFKPIDIASIVYFRIAFGALMFLNMAGTLIFDMDAWANPDFRFAYEGFHWIKPLPGYGMHIVFILLSLLGISIAIGFKYRLSAVLFFLAFTYVFLTEQAKYLNHYYLIILVGFLLIFIPANRAFSADARHNPHIRTDTTPAWHLMILRFQMGVVYFFGGIAKINPDWLRGEPMRLWLAKRHFFPAADDFIHSEIGAYFFSYGGLFLDLLIVPLLIWRRTRIWAFSGVIFFHLSNAFIFNIGVFPFLSVATTALFFSPSFPRNRLRMGKAPSPAIGEFSPSPGPIGKRFATVFFISCYAALQTLLPLRHFLYPGDVNWTAEGHEFSWRMKLVDRKGEATFIVTDPKSGGRWVVNPEEHLTPFQYRKMATRPDLILQFGKHLAEEFREKGYGDVQVRVQSLLSINGSSKLLFVNPEADLALIETSGPVADWTLPPPPERENPKRDKG